jgi:hypothetical protein
MASEQVGKVKEYSRELREQGERQANVVLRFMQSAYKVSITAGQDMSLKALDIPADILDEMDVAPDRVKAIRAFNRKVIGSVYGGLGSLAEKVSSGLGAPLRGIGRLRKKGSDVATVQAEKVKTAAKTTRAKQGAAKTAKPGKAVVAATGSAGAKKAAKTGATRKAAARSTAKKSRSPATAGPTDKLAA